MSNRDQRLTQLLIKYRNNDLSPSEYEEFLLLIGGPESEKIIDTMAERDWQGSAEILLGMEFDEERGSRKSYKIVRWGLMIAASVTLIISLFNYWPFHLQKIESITHRTSYGETKSIILPDSSKVLLNANTQLSWDNNWKRKGIRKVKLEGEAFFEVKKLNGTEFVVQSGDVKVKVLGTVFNVRNRRGLTDVFLESGKVKLELDNIDGKTITMEPGNSVHYDDKRTELVVKESTTLIRNASWVDGMLDFQNESLADILNRFEELYGKKFQIENKALLSKRMDLSLPYANWELIRNALEISLDIEFEEHENTIIVN
ncbi:FecR domain-containing protein [Dyadobacter sp. CY323]|uniref:FecR family protein n=1 Tax=Dyadobacter sp. CY323 TaxID=2907302 RepID=UPI001F18236A|nr:FecR domain-containing protein [Dyadobacter sp. CY323]MCE6989829.1 FecR domain-containing protein [Dyadobacter sp. CY323]